MQKPGTVKLASPIGRFFDELLLYSGQYALFYILMNFAQEKLGYFSNFGHTVLLFILVLQTLFLANFGSKPVFRFIGSLLAPLIYTLLESGDEANFVFNIAHMFFWIFSLLTGALQAVFLVVENRKLKQSLEFIITTLNVVIFLFVYFFFDLRLTIREELSAGRLTQDQAQTSLQIQNLLPALRIFFQDPAHVFAVLGGLLLAFSLSIGRAKIVALKDTLNELFGRYVDKSIRDRIVVSEETKSERQTLCIFFTDIKNFTTTTERADAAAVTAMLNTAFSRWDILIRSAGGVIDKFIGDSVMVLFGMTDKAKDAETAVSCAMKMIAELPELQADLKQAGLPVLEGIRIGINKGEVILGDIGSPDRRNYTVVGDAVNTASRLEAVCKEFNASLIISESAYLSLPVVIQKKFFRLGEISLKGKAEKVSAYAFDQKK